MNSSNHEADMWTIEDIQNDEQLRIRVPCLQGPGFLSHAAVCPLPACVSQAIADYASACQFGDQEDAAVSLNAQTRLLAANLLGVQSSEVALVGPTSLALSFVASGFPWRKGDAILVYQDDYPSNVYPWMALSEWGVNDAFSMCLPQAASVASMSRGKLMKTFGWWPWLPVIFSAAFDSKSKP